MFGIVLEPRYDRVVCLLSFEGVDVVAGADDADDDDATAGVAVGVVVAAVTVDVGLDEE